MKFYYNNITGCVEFCQTLITGKISPQFVANSILSIAVNASADFVIKTKVHTKTFSLALNRVKIVFKTRNEFPISDTVKTASCILCF